MEIIKNNCVLGVDIGGSHITAGIVDMDLKCMIGNKEREFVDSKGPATHILGTWIDVLDKTIQQSKNEIDKIAFAMPGPFNYEAGISLITGFDKFECIYGIDVKEYICKQLYLQPENIIFRNDAEAFLHGEMFCGAGRDMGTAIGLTLGTGFGSAFHQNGVTIDLNWGSDPFKKSIADDYFSTRWLVNRYFDLTGKSVDNVKQIIDIRDNDDAISKIFNEFAVNLATFLAPRILNKGCKNIILGGNITKTKDLFVDKLQAHLKEENLHVTFSSAQLHEDAALIGAAASFEKITV